MPLTYLRTLRNSIKELSKWESSGEAFGFIDSVDDTNPDYIYEFYVAMRILDDLNANHRITLEPGTGGYIFPQKPKPKGKWAKFLIKKKNSNDVLFQYCLGVEINISSAEDSPFGADISFQCADAPDDVNEEHVILIMDAKYKSDKTSKLSINLIRAFGMSVHDLEVPKEEMAQLQFDLLKELNANCLITNGQVIEKHGQYCFTHNLKQVGRFDYDARDIITVG